MQLLMRLLTMHPLLKLLMKLLMKLPPLKQCWPPQPRQN
jgi:hypothetical protein